MLVDALGLMEKEIKRHDKGDFKTRQFLFKNLQIYTVDIA